MADLIKEQLNLATFEELRVVLVHHIPKLIQLAHRQATLEAVEVSQGRSERHLSRRLVVRHSLLSRLGRLICLLLQRTGLVSKVVVSLRFLDSEAASCLRGVRSAACRSFVQVQLGLIGVDLTAAQRSAHSLGLLTHIHVGSSVPYGRVSIDISSKRSINTLNSFLNDYHFTLNGRRLHINHLDLLGSNERSVSRKATGCFAAASHVARGSLHLSFDVGRRARLQSRILSIALKSFCTLGLLLADFFKHDLLFRNLDFIVLMLGLLGVDDAAVAKHRNDHENSRCEYAQRVDGEDFREMYTQGINTEPMQHVNDVEQEQHADNGEVVADGVLIHAFIKLLVAGDDTDGARVTCRCP